VEESQRSELIRVLTVTSALIYLGWILWFFQVVQRASRVGATRFSNEWEQKIEALGFIAFPPNAPALAFAALAAAAATWMAGSMQSLPLAILLRIIRWSANALVVIGTLSVLSVIIGEAEGPDRLGTVAFRMGGVVISAAISYFCLAAGRTAPGG
jgi:hypothetical protein